MTSGKKILFLLSVAFICFFISTFPAISAPLPTDDETDVIIIGGGLSGLSTAYKLKKEGISYKILELEPRVGGRVRTADYAKEGVKVEAGLAEFWESNPAVEIIKELNIPHTKEFSYSSLILDGKLYPFLGEGNDNFIRKLLSEKEIKALNNIDSLMARVNKLIKEKKFKSIWKLKDISFADWIKQNGLPRKVQELIRLSIEPEIGTAWDTISALDGIAEWHIFLGEGEMAYVLDNGNASLINALADSVGRENIGTSMQVTRIKTTSEGVEVEARDTSNYKYYLYKAKYAVSTIPLFRLAELQIEPLLSAKKQEAIFSQGWGNYFTAHVFMDKAAAKYWTVQGKNILPILSDGPLGVIYYDFPSDKEDTLVVNLLVTGAHADGFNYRGASLDAAGVKLKETFDALWPGSSKHIKKFEFVRYHPRAIASWPVGRSRFDELSEEIRRPHGHIYFAGDFTESSHSDGAVISANRVVKDIVKALKK